MEIWEVIKWIIVAIVSIAGIIAVIVAVGIHAIYKATRYFFEINEKDDRTNV